MFVYVCVVCVFVICICVYEFWCVCGSFLCVNVVV